MIREEGTEQKGEGDKQGTRKPVWGRGKCQNKGVTTSLRSFWQSK